MQKIFSYSLLLNNSEKPFDFKGFFRAFAAAGSGYIFRRLSVYTAGFPLGQAKSGTENGNPSLGERRQKKAACRALRTEMRRVGRVDFNCLTGSAEYYV